MDESYTGLRQPQHNAPRQPQHNAPGYRNHEVHDQPVTENRDSFSSITLQVGADSVEFPNVPLVFKAEL